MTNETKTYAITEEQRSRFPELIESLRYGTLGDAAAAKETILSMLASLPLITGEPVATPPFGSKRKAALALYKAPFKFEHGYIFDVDHHMVADDDDVESHVAARVRGWGRIGYMPDAAQLQDEVGRVIADALTAYWEQSQPLHGQDLTTGKWYAGEDIDKMVRELDVALYGEKAARQAMLCDIVQPLIKRLTAQPLQPEDFDTWQKSPYTIVLQKSIDEDYQPKLQPITVDDVTDGMIKDIFPKSFLTLSKNSAIYNQVKNDSANIYNAVIKHKGDTK